MTNPISNNKQAFPITNLSSTKTNAQHKIVKEVLETLTNIANTKFHNDESESAKVLLGLIYVICQTRYIESYAILIEKFTDYLQKYPQSLVIEPLLKLTDCQKVSTELYGFSAARKSAIERTNNLIYELDHYDLSPDDILNKAVAKLADSCYEPSVINMSDLKEIISLILHNVLKQVGVDLPLLLQIPIEINQKISEFLDYKDLCKLKNLNTILKYTHMFKHDKELWGITKKYKISYDHLLTLYYHNRGKDKIADIEKMLQSSKDIEQTNKEIKIVALKLYNFSISKNETSSFPYDLAGFIIKSKITGFSNLKELEQHPEYNLLQSLDFPLVGLAHIKNIDYAWLKLKIQDLSNTGKFFRNLAINKFIRNEIVSFDTNYNKDYHRAKLKTSRIDIPKDNDEITAAQAIELFGSYVVGLLDGIFNSQEKVNFGDVLDFISDAKRMIKECIDYFKAYYADNELLVQINAVKPSITKNWDNHRIKIYDTKQTEAYNFLSKVFPEFEHSRKSDSVYTFNRADRYDKNLEGFRPFSAYIPVLKSFIQGGNIDNKRSFYHSVMHNFYVFDLIKIRSIRYFYYDAPFSDSIETYLEKEDSPLSMSIYNLMLYKGAIYIPTDLADKLLEHAAKCSNITSLEEYNKIIAEFVIAPLHILVENEYTKSQQTGSTADYYNITAHSLFAISNQF